MSDRTTFPELAMLLAYASISRSEDPYVKVGACALRHDMSVAGVGYNGAPPEVRYEWSNRDDVPTKIHAEFNCTVYSRPGELALVAVTLMPCERCLTELARYRVPKIYYGGSYERTSPRILELAKLMNIELIHLPIPFDKLPNRDTVTYEQEKSAN